MDDSIRVKLNQIVKEHGTSIRKNSSMCEALLNEYSPANKKEITALMGVLTEGGVDILMSDPENYDLARNSAVERVCNNTPMHDEAVLWAVETWALALGIINEPTVSKYGTVQTTQTINTYSSGIQTYNDSGKMIPVLSQSIFRELKGIKPIIFGTAALLIVLYLFLPSNIFKHGDGRRAKAVLNGSEPAKIASNETERIIVKANTAPGTKVTDNTGNSGNADNSINKAVTNETNGSADISKNNKAGSDNAAGSNDNMSPAAQKVIVPTDLGSLQVEVNGNSKTYYPSWEISRSDRSWTLFLRLDKNSEKDSFYISFPLEIKAGDVITFENTNNKGVFESTQDALFQFNRNETLQYKTPEGISYYFGSLGKTDNNARISIQSWDGEGGYAVGTLSAELKTDTGKSISFQNGRFKIKIK